MNSVDAFDTLAHRLLSELDVRHDQVLDELDALNRRVDAVLSQYTQVEPDDQPRAQEEFEEREPSDDDE